MAEQASAGGFIFNGSSLDTDVDNAEGVLSPGGINMKKPLPSPQAESPSYRQVQKQKVKSFGDPNDDQLYNQLEDFFSTPGPK